MNTHLEIVINTKGYVVNLLSQPSNSILNSTIFFIFMPLFLNSMKRIKKALNVKQVKQTSMVESQEKSYKNVNYHLNNGRKPWSLVLCFFNDQLSLNPIK